MLSRRTVIFIIIFIGLHIGFPVFKNEVKYQHICDHYKFNSNAVLNFLYRDGNWEKQNMIQ